MVAAAALVVSAVGFAIAIVVEAIHALEPSLAARAPRFGRRGRRAVWVVAVRKSVAVVVFAIEAGARRLVW